MFYLLVFYAIKKGWQKGVFCPLTAKLTSDEKKFCVVMEQPRTLKTAMKKLKLKK
jgi:hypothetical protein